MKIFGAASDSFPWKNEKNKNYEQLLKAIADNTLSLYDKERNEYFTPTGQLIDRDKYKSYLEKLTDEQKRNKNVGINK